MPRQTMTQMTHDEMIVSFTDRKYRRVAATTPVIPGTYAGKYVLLAAIAINIDASEAQMDAFEASIEAIANVHKAFVMLGPAAIPVAEIPAGNDLRIQGEIGFTVEPTP